MHKPVFGIISPIILIIWLIIPMPIHAQRIAPTLTELIDSAIQKDYTLGNQQIDIGLSVLDKEKLSNEFLPRVRVNGSDAFILTSISLRTKEINIPELNIDIKESRNRLTATAGLVTVSADASILLYSGGKIPLLKKSLGQKIKGQTHLTEKEKQDIISEVVSVYDQLALLKQVRIVLDESKKRLAEHMKIADKSFSYGLITKYERQKIEVAQAQLASKIEDYEGKRAIVQQRLYWLTNIPIERISLIENRLKAIVNVLNDNTISNRPELKALDAFIIAHHYKIKAEKKWFVPKIQAASSLKYLGIIGGHLESSKALVSGYKLSAQMPGVHISPAFHIGIGFSWDLFDGREGRLAVKKATLELHKTENNKKDLFEKLELNLTKSRSEYEVSLMQVNVTEKQQETSSNALTQASKEYRTGLIRTSQLIDAEEDFQNASLGLIQALYNQRRAAVELLKATGSLATESFK